MSKKMKRVASGSSPYGLTHHQDARDVSKHQMLLEEFQELQKETEAMRNKMEFMKQRKSTLSAEVRFLRRRYKYLLEIKSNNKPQKGKELAQTQNLVSKSKNNTTKAKPQRRKVDANQQNSTMVSNVKQKGRVSVPKESAYRNPSPVLDLNQKVRMLNEQETSLRNASSMFVERLYGEKEASFRSPNSILDLNRQGTGYSRKESFPQKPALAFDLNEVERAPMRREDVVQGRAPIFDLNQTMGEEELEDFHHEPLLQNVEANNSKLPVRNRADEQQNDLKLSVCRNVGSGPSRTGKRKISWQDQMALQV